MKIEFKSQKKTNQYLQILICFIIGFSTIKGGFLTLIRSVIVIPSKLDVVIPYTLFMVFIFLSIKAIISRIKPDTIILLILITIAYLVSLLIEMQEYSLQIGLELLIGFIIYTVTRALRSYDDLIKYLNITSILIILSVIIVFIIFPTNEVTMISYSQTFAYAIFPAVIFSFNSFMNNRSILQLIYFAIAFVLIIIAGARGPVVISILFIFIRVFQVIKNIGGGIKVWSTLLVFSICVFMAIIFMPKIEDIITKYSFQDSNRLLEMLRKDDLLEDEGRNSLKTKSIALILDHPFGMGLGQERVALSDITMQAEGSYPHNFFLEILIQYGWILGFAIIVLLLYFMFISYINNNNNNTKNIWLMFFFIGYIPLMFSGSYINWPLFWLFLGLTVNFIHENKFVRKN
jgi:O-antigen ligase